MGQQTKQKAPLQATSVKTFYGTYSETEGV